MLNKVTSAEAFQPMLLPGEFRVYVCPDSDIVIKVFAVAGGSFTRCDVRGPHGELMADFGGTWMFETTALNAAAEMVRWLQADAAERAAASR